ncbi:hypothetical protein, partial [Thiolapillus sp.]|uniref:hypothetical protein n=1 Tax=Thiolapillus sp. TaxID=2017437 RepID=UPI0025CDC708
MNKRHPTVRPERQNLNPEIALGRWIYSITQYSTMGYAYIGKIQSVTKPRSQACLRPRDRFWDIPVPKIDSAFDNLFVPQPSWSPSTTQ